MEIEVLKVSSKSVPNMVAGALAGVLREAGIAELQSVGAGAVNQAVKAIAIATGFMAAENKQVICKPAFKEITIDGTDRTAIRFVVEALPADAE